MSERKGERDGIFDSGNAAGDIHASSIGRVSSSSLQFHCKYIMLPSLTFA